MTITPSTTKADDAAHVSRWVAQLRDMDDQELAAADSQMTMLVAELVCCPSTSTRVARLVNQCVQAVDDQVGARKDTP